MFKRAAVMVVLVMLCLGSFASDAPADDNARGYVDLAFSIRDPYRDTTEATAVRDPYRDTTFVSTPDGGIDTCVGGLPMTFALYKTEEDAEPLWKEELSCVPVDENDYVEVLLGQTTALSSEIVTGYDALYLEVTIEGEVIRPRILVVFSDHVLVMDAVSTSPESVEGATNSNASSTVVYSAGQRSLGAVGFGSDPVRPRLVFFGNAPLSRTEKLTAAEIQALTARQLFEHQKTIEMLGLELKKLKAESRGGLH